MAFDREPHSLAKVTALAVFGAAALASWQHGMWGALIGSAAVIVWLVALTSAKARPRALPSGAEERGEEQTLPLRLLLDQVPVPLVSAQAGIAQALNRAARTLFSTDEHILPYPQVLEDPAAAYLAHEGRRWRIDRVEAQASTGPLTIAALIDIESEERAAEVRVAADMIQVLGHELLNGLAPIVSLAESGLAAITAPTPDTALLSEILSTLARRVEGLLRFTEAYRAMARLPDPIFRPVHLAAIADDMAVLFGGRWADTVKLEMSFPDLVLPADRDQVSQAVWALLQNAAEAALAAGGCPKVELKFEQSTGAVLIDVSDNGGGIPAEQVPQIFRPFHTTKPLGTGVGLSLARQIAHAHGGDLTLSRLAPTTFTLMLPIEA